MPAILLIDAGSTKSEWSLIYDELRVPVRFTAKGINPLQQDIKEIILIFSEAKVNFLDSQIEEIHFFGTGCVSEKEIDLITTLLKEVWPQADIYVKSDMVGAGIALFGEDTGIACILGTGSNSCLFSQKRIITQIPSLGFILGDEGGGASLGKRLINGIFKKQFSKNLTDKFFQTYQITLPGLIERVYCDSMPAAFLASFAIFIANNFDNPEIEDMVENEFDSFFQKNIIPYQETKNYLTGFVGSIAFNFSAVLKKTAKKYGVEINKIIPEPMRELEKFYCRRNDNEAFWNITFN